MPSQPLTLFLFINVYKTDGIHIIRNVIKKAKKQNYKYIYVYTIYVYTVL